MSTTDDSLDNEDLEALATLALTEWASFVAQVEPVRAALVMAAVLADVRQLVGHAELEVCREKLVLIDTVSKAIGDLPAYQESMETAFFNAMAEEKSTSKETGEA